MPIMTKLPPGQKLGSGDLAFLFCEMACVGVGAWALKFGSGRLALARDICPFGGCWGRAW